MENGRECRRIGADKYTDSKSDQLRYYPYKAGLPELKKGAYEAERGSEKMPEVKKDTAARYMEILNNGIGICERDYKELPDGGLYPAGI